MKILIVSDTHRYLGNLQTALEEEGSVDMLIHLGDIRASDGRWIRWQDVRYI